MLVHFQSRCLLSKELQQGIPLCFSQLLKKKEVRVLKRSFSFVCWAVTHPAGCTAQSNAWEEIMEMVVNKPTPFLPQTGQLQFGLFQLWQKHPVVSMVQWSALWDGYFKHNACGVVLVLEVFIVVIPRALCKEQRGIVWTSAVWDTGLSFSCSGKLFMVGFRLAFSSA